MLRTKPRMSWRPILSALGLTALVALALIGAVAVGLFLVAHAYAGDAPPLTPVAADPLLVERLKTLSAHIYTRQAQIETLKTQAQLEALEAARRLGIDPAAYDLDVERGLFVPRGVKEP